MDFQEQQKTKNKNNKKTKPKQTKKPPHNSEVLTVAWMLDIY